MSTRQFKIQETDYKDQTDEFLHRVCDFWDITFRWYEKDDPLPNREQRLKSLRDPHPHQTSFNWVVFNAEDEIIATAGMGFSNDKSPSYEDNKDIFGGSIEVLPKYRRQGLGKKLFRLILDRAKEHNKKILQSGAVLEEGISFLENYLGGTVAQVGAENRLQLAEVDWHMLDEWRDAGQSKNPDTKLIFFEDCPEEIIDDYMKIYTEVMNQMPKGDMEWTYKGTPEQRRLSEKRNKDRGMQWFTLITQEADGHISGLTEMLYNPKRSFKISQELTGVKMDDRGRGLGKWLKAEMLIRMNESFPDIKYVSTGNADENAPMLSINHRMGFKPNLTWKGYNIQLSSLEHLA